MLANLYLKLLLVLPICMYCSAAPILKQSVRFIATRWSKAAFQKLIARSPGKSFLHIFMVKKFAFSLTFLGFLSLFVQNIFNISTTQIESE